MGQGFVVGWHRAAHNQEKPLQCNTRWGAHLTPPAPALLPQPQLHAHLTISRTTPPHPPESRACPNALCSAINQAGVRQQDVALIGSNALARSPTCASCASKQVVRPRRAPTLWCGSTALVRHRPEALSLTNSIRFPRHAGSLQPWWLQLTGNGCTARGAERFVRLADNLTGLAVRRTVHASSSSHLQPPTYAVRSHRCDH